MRKLDKSLLMEFKNQVYEKKQHQQNAQSDEFLSQPHLVCLFSLTFQLFQLRLQLTAALSCERWVQLQSHAGALARPSQAALISWPQFQCARHWNFACLRMFLTRCLLPLTTKQLSTAPVLKLRYLNKHIYLHIYIYT